MLTVVSISGSTADAPSGRAFASVSLSSVVCPSFSPDMVSSAVCPSSLPDMVSSPVSVPVLCSVCGAASPAVSFWAVPEPHGAEGEDAVPQAHRLPESAAQSSSGHSDYNGSVFIFFFIKDLLV